MLEKIYKTWRKLPIKHWQVVNAGLIIYDILAVNAAFLLALWLRFDCQISTVPEYYLEAFFKFAPIYTVLCILIFWYCKLYKSIWRFASYNELLRTIFATVITFIVQVIGITVLFERMPI